MVVEKLFKDMARQNFSYKKQPPVWIFGLWRIFTGKLPYDISRMFLTHAMALGNQFLPEMHPALEIMRCLSGRNGINTRQLFTDFISSIWIDSVKEIASLLESRGMTAASSLPPSIWMGAANSPFHQSQESVLEFRRLENIETWQQRNTDFAFTLCRPRQIFHCAPSHSDILTLMWLRQSVVDTTRLAQLVGVSNEGHQRGEISLVKSAILTRLELSLGMECDQGRYDDIRILAGDVYQVAHHHRWHGDNMDSFKLRHTLDQDALEKSKMLLQQTKGMETERSSWFKWLQILEASLIGRRDQPELHETQPTESAVSHELLDGRGMLCDYTVTKYGTIGVVKGNCEKDPEAMEEGWMCSGLVILQN